MRLFRQRVQGDQRQDVEAFQTAVLGLVSRQNISAHVPMRLDVSSVGLIDPARHGICHEVAKPPQS
jgi:hypothetical protein